MSMNILLYGAGAVGLGLASCLMKSGHRVDLLARSDTADALRKNGLLRTGLFGEHHTEEGRFAVASFMVEYPERDYDFVLVCTKSYDSENAAQDLSEVGYIKNSDVPIVLCQNGWGNAETFSGYFPKPRIKSGRVITGFKRPQLHEVEITVHADAIQLGTLFGRDIDDLYPLAEGIEGGGIPCGVTSTIGRDLWAKMLYNCMLNGLSTLFDVPYGHLGESQHTRELMNQLAQEVFVVMQAVGHDTHWTSADGYLDTFYKHQLPPTYDHIPSMLQDIRAGKKTEIDALNGAVVQLGEHHGIPVPYNTMVYSSVKFLEERESFR